MPDPTSVRDRLFLLAHDEYRDWKPRVHQPTLELGLAAATLIDLLIAGRVWIEGGHARIVDLYDRTSTGDPIADTILDWVRNLRPAPELPRLLREMRPGLYDRTLGLLLATGVVARTSRRLRAHYRLVDEGPVVRIRGELRWRINGQDRNEITTDAMCELISALELHDCLMFDLTRGEVDTRLRQITARIPELVEPQSPLKGVPIVGKALRAAIGDLATAVYR